MCAGLTAADLAEHLRVDPVAFADQLERALTSACGTAALVTGVAEIPDTGERLGEWQTAILVLAARRFSRRESPLGVSGGFADVPVYVRGADPDVDALFAQLTERAGLA